MKFSPFILLLLAYAWSTESGKSKIQEMGKEKLVYGKDTIEVNIRMQKTGQRLFFLKSGEGITIDSTVNPDGTYHVEEKQRFSERYRMESGEQTFYFFDKNRKLIQRYSIGTEKTQLYDDKGVLFPIYKEVMGDTVFYNIDYFNQWDGSIKFIE